MDLANPIKSDLAAMIAKRDSLGNYFNALNCLLDLDSGERLYPFNNGDKDLLNFGQIFSVEVAFSSTTDQNGELPYVRLYNDDFSRFGLARTEANKASSRLSVVSYNVSIVANER